MLSGADSPLLLAAMSSAEALGNEESPQSCGGHPIRAAISDSAADYLPESFEPWPIRSGSIPDRK